SDEIVADLVVPALVQQDPSLRLEVGKDVRVLLIQEVIDHLEALGRRGRNVCFVEPKYAGTGPDEQEALAQYFHERHGMRVLHADPSELTLRGNEVYYDDQVVDLGYRDYCVYDLMELEREGVNVDQMRALFKQNRMISSIGAEIDQKSCWEVLTDPELAQKYFSAEERQVFRRHVLWTRVLSDRRTALPDGTTGDLIAHVREERES